MRLGHGLATLGAPAGVSAAFTGALWTFWTATATGLRRVYEVKDDFLHRAKELRARVTGRPRSATGAACNVYEDVLSRLRETPAAFGPATGAEVTHTAEALLAAHCAAVEAWHSLETELAVHDESALQEKLRSVLVRRQCTTDGVTTAHLARAEVALRAQQRALQDLRVGRERSEAAADVHLALLERLRLAVAHFEMTDRERFSLELGEVSSQAAKVSEDLDSVASILAAADAHEDRRVLAEAEASVRRVFEETRGENAEVAALEPTSEPVVTRS
jgi:hypothetical protein